MRDVVIVEAVRTPIGKFRGGLKDVRADHLAALVLQRLLAAAGVQADVVEDVVFGCVTQVGEQCANIARTALLSAGWPESIPGITVDRKCGSSEAAIHLAANAIVAGSCDVVVAGGAESMSRVPMGGNRDVHGDPFGWRLRNRFELTSQGEAAERICDIWGLSREALDEFAVASHQRAAVAADSGRFSREIVPVPVNEECERDAAPTTDRLEIDETIRRGTSLEKLAALKSSFRLEGGRHTAGNSSQICDGAAALLLMEAGKARALGLRARARIRSIATVGSDPQLMLTGPMAATRRVVQRAGLSLEDIDLFEVNEAFAAVPLIWMRELGVGQDILNVNGGAIALGHPLGASGARIMTTLLNELERRDATFGVQSMCCAGGLATATVLERLA
jgi:acetyl-CoA acyltransferase